MNQITAVLLGTGICCVVPLACLSIGVYLGKYGMPVSVSWRSRNVEED